MFLFSSGSLTFRTAMNAHLSVHVYHEYNFSFHETPEQLVCCALQQLCVSANYVTMAAVTEKACTTDTCVSFMCIKEKKRKIHPCLSPPAADAKLRVRGHKRSNMQRFAHLHVWVFFELNRGTQLFLLYGRLAIIQTLIIHIVG